MNSISANEMNTAIKELYNFSESCFTHTISFSRQKAYSIYNLKHRFICAIYTQGVTDKMLPHK